MKAFPYESVFAHASFQFCGHVDEYLVENARHLALMFVQPRFGEHCHVLRRYEEGRLVEERKIKSSQGLFGYYFRLFLNHNLELWRFARRQSGRTLVMCGHPVAMFFMSVQKLFHRLSYFYWIGDYFPERRLVIRAYERVKKFYADRVDYTFYLTNPINAAMNGGEVVDKPDRRTVMWGLSPFADCTFPRPDSRKFLFVGLVREGQGIREMLEFLARAKDCSLAIVGVSAAGYGDEVRAMIGRLGLSDRVYFADRFHSEEELREIAKTCFAGLALYHLESDNFTHYADPGKVKAYAELGLPVVMTRISAVAPVLERFKAGVVLDSLAELPSAVERIRADYPAYAAGLAAFNAHFDYRAYYSERFKAVEETWR